MKCKYDRESNEYLIDGERCRVDEDGQPTKHCGARLTCSNHVARHELTCSRCIGRARSDIRQIAALSTLMLPAAIDDGVTSQAADLAGPAADPRAVSAIRVYVQGHAGSFLRRGKISEETYDKILTALPDEDEWHPYSVLTRWQMMLSEDYGHPLPPRLTLATAAAYLERNLHLIAQDPEQDFPLLARELRRVRSRLESALHNSQRAERGEPCPDCKDEGHVVRMVREYGHWCTEEDCTKLHYIDDSGDTWKCPRNSKHDRDQHDYESYIEERRIGA
jgi:hypothetical protein